MSNFLNVGDVKLKVKQKNPDLLVLDLFLCNIKKNDHFYSTLTSFQVNKESQQFGHEILSDEMNEILSRLSTDFIEWKTKFGEGKIPVIDSYKVDEVRDGCYIATITVSWQAISIYDVFSGVKDIPEDF